MVAWSDDGSESDHITPDRLEVVSNACMLKNLNGQNALDFNAEAKRLRGVLGIDGSGGNNTYHDMDSIWRDKRTGGALSSTERQRQAGEEENALRTIVGGETRLQG